MYGYATDETEEMIPLSHLLSHQLLKCAVHGGIHSCIYSNFCTSVAQL